MSSVFDLRKIGLILTIAGLSLLADRLGYFGSWNQRLADTRMALSQRPADGEIVFVAVDAKSVSEVGSWPWSRSVHASLLGELSQAGARDVVFDFDFTFPSDPGGDLAFAEALKETGGSTYLAVFEQSATANDPSGRHYNVPLPAFAQNSWPALVNVQTDASGFVRYYPFGRTIDGEFIVSAGALIANAFEPGAQTFEIDFSIQADSVPVVSAIDVLKGIVSPEVFAGRSVIVGASAVELSDQLAVPVQGVISGPLVHALAAETLLRGRAIGWMRAEWVALGLALALLLLGTERGPRHMVSIAVTTLAIASVELAALSLFDKTGIMVPSALLYPGLLAFVVGTLVQSLKTSDWLLLKTSAEARNTFRILDRVFEDSLDGVVVMKEDGSILRHSASANQIFDTGDDGRLILPDVLRRAEPLPTSAPARTIELPHANGTRILEYRARLSEVERLASVGKPPVRETIKTLVLRDITQAKEQERDIAYLSNYDDRTGALRRNAFLAFLGLRLDDNRDAVVFALTLDRFKTINVTLGRGVGDAILREVVARIERSALLLSSPARLGGTSFAVYTESAAEESCAETLAESLLAEISEVYRLKDVNAQIGVRIGYSAVKSQSGTTPEDALDQAVEAMDMAKSSGLPVARYDRNAWEKQKRSREIERALETALENNEFYLLYQPQHRVSDGSLIGAEALIRWESPTLGSVHPDEFIDIAESTGFIVELGNWTLEQAAKDALSLPSELVIAVNVSGIQIMRGNLVEDTTRILKKVGLPPSRICLELTETVMLSQSSQIIETMQDLRFLGVVWALDDFGTGFSSMEYLSKMPLDKVKLDKSFTMRLNYDPTARPVLHATSELSRGLGVKLLCEGVETPEQLAVLSEEGCEEAQGYLFGKPAPVGRLLGTAGIDTI